MSPRFADPVKPAIPVIVLSEDALQSWVADQPAQVSQWVKTCEFTGALNQSLIVPDSNGGASFALVGYGTPDSRNRVQYALAGGAAGLPAGVYALSKDLTGSAAETECIGWLLEQYAFSTYRRQSPMKAQLKAPENVDAHRIETIVQGEFWTRDLINTPASDMGPENLEKAVRDLARRHKAKLVVVSGDDLLNQNFPMIHAVGRAAQQAPRLIDMRWGKSGPKITLVGKGVCFDTGGLNLKPGASMGLMKKDMGGAANVIGLAHMIMSLGLKVQLRVLIPAVENSVSGNAFRPQDILTSRKGLTVEINNTDAEGRLVLADALALADEETPDLIVSMATLTGAARVALGPDLAPFFTDDEATAAALIAAADRSADPVWRMPFHTPYEKMIEPGIADLDNAPKGGFAGAITAALFLRRFVSLSPRYLHFDIYGWRPTKAPGRSKGGAMQGARTILAALPDVLRL